MILIIFRPPLKRDLPIIWTYRWPVFWIGTTGIGAYNTLQYSGLNHIIVSNVGLLQTTIPIVLCLLEWLVFKEKITRTQMLGTMVATIGVGVVLLKTNLANLLHLSFNFGDLIMVGAILCMYFLTAHMLFSKTGKSMVISMGVIYYRRIRVITIAITGISGRLSKEPHYWSYSWPKLYYNWTCTSGV